MIIAERVARRYAANVLRVYHGTQDHKLPDIRKKGLISLRGYSSAKWYMVAEDFRSAAEHAIGYEGSPVVVEFHLPLVEGAKWDGYPYLWKPLERGPKARWWALRQPLPAKFIRAVHPVS